MKKFLMMLAVTTMAVSPVLTTQAQAASRTTVTKNVDIKHGKKTVTTRVVTKAWPSNRYNSRKTSNSRSKVAATKARWSKGQKFNSRKAVNYKVIKNPRVYRLKNAPRGHRWVRSGNDAVLVSVASGIVGGVIVNAIRS